MAVSTESPTKRPWRHRHTLACVAASLAVGGAGGFGLSTSLSSGDFTLVPVWAILIFIGLSGLTLTRLAAWMLMD